jgi:hypothetical protein
MLDFGSGGCSLSCGELILQGFSNVRLIEGKYNLLQGKLRLFHQNTL